MKKGIIALIGIFLLAISSLSTILGQNPMDDMFVEGVPFDCYNEKLVWSFNTTLQPGENRSYSVPSFILEDCYYYLQIKGQTQECIECTGDPPLAIFWITAYYKGEEHGISSPQFDPECGVVDGVDIRFPFSENEFIQGSVIKEFESIQVVNSENSDCPITYSWKLYSICECKGKQALYPKVDIEQFSVTGGSTIIKDGKILSAFNVVPGVQQTMIQVENRGFFTQKDARVRFVGLPEGVTVELSPAIQTIKAHNIGTYSATFTVGSNVPPGTYNIAMVAFSPNGTFDTIRIQLVVP